MSTTTTSKTKNSTPKGNGGPDQSAPDGGSTSPASTAGKKPITVLVNEQLHRKVKVLAELSGTSVSDVVEAQIKIVVREQLPGLLSKLDTAD